MHDARIARTDRAPPPPQERESLFFEVIASTTSRFTLEATHRGKTKTMHFFSQFSFCENVLDGWTTSIMAIHRSLCSMMGRYADVGVAIAAAKRGQQVALVMQLEDAAKDIMRLLVDLEDVPVNVSASEIEGWQAKVAAMKDALLAVLGDRDRVANMLCHLRSCEASLLKNIRIPLRLRGTPLQLCSAQDLRDMPPEQLYGALAEIRQTALKVTGDPSTAFERLQEALKEEEEEEEEQEVEQKEDWRAGFAADGAPAAMAFAADGAPAAAMEGIEEEGSDDIIRKRVREEEEEEEEEEAS